MIISHFTRKVKVVYNGYMKKHLQKLFGGLDITWPKLIIFAIIMGIYTALMAMFVPDGNSFHDIAVTPEWWVLPAIIVIANSKKPLEAALKTFVFFLISQPLVYLLQVPFNNMGWGLFGYYDYWFKITLLTFPGAFLGWYIKKDKWYSGLILSVMAVLLVLTGINYAIGLTNSFPNHLLSTIYCFSIIPVFIFGIFKDKKPMLITAVISVATIIASLVVFNMNEPFEITTNSVFSENDIVFTSDPTITKFASEGNGDVVLRKVDEDYFLDIKGEKGKNYSFTITDGDTEYKFEYHFDNEKNTVVVNKE